MAGTTLGIDAVVPKMPKLTKAQTADAFMQSLAAGAKTGAAVPNPAGLTRDEADKYRSEFYTQFYSGQPVQRIADKPVPVSYDYMFGARNDDKPYVSPYDAERYGVMSQAPGGLLPSNQFGGSLNGGVPLLDTAASNTAATLAGAANALFGPGYGMIVGAGKALQGGPMVQNFGEGYVQGEGDVRQLLDPAMDLNRNLAGNAADIVNVGSFAGLLPGVGAAMRTAAMRAGAGIPRTAAVIPQAAGIDAALTPRQAQFRQLMDSLNADPANAALAAPRPVSAGPRIPPGVGQPVSAIPPADSDILEKIVGNLGTRAQRDAVRSTSNVYDDTLNAALEDALGVTRADPYASVYSAVDDALKSPMPFVPDSPNFVSSYPDMLDLVGPRRPDFMPVDEAANVLRPGPRVAADADKRMDPFTKNMLIAATAGAGVGIPALAGLSLLANGQLGPAPTATTPLPTDGSRGIDVAASVNPLASGNVWSPELLEAVTGSAPVDPRAAYGEAQRVMREQRNNERVAAAEKEWENLPDELGSGITPGTVKRRGNTQVRLDEFGRIVPAVGSDEQLPASDAGLPLDTGAETFPQWDLRPPAHIPGGLETAIRPTVVADLAADPEDIAKVLPVDTSLTGPMAEAAIADFMAPEEKTRRDEDTNRPESEFGSYAWYPSGSAGDEAATAAPAAGTKFTPGPGQFVGTNGYIYEQSSDGSFKNVGRVPGYTPAQLSEAANKGAFRDPNNIVVGSGKRKKKDSNESLVASDSREKKGDTISTDTGGTGTDGTGTGGTGTGTYTPPTQAMLDALYAPYMRQYNGPGVGYVPGVDPERNYVTPAFADGGLVDGRLVLGDGGPKEDKIPAMIDGVEQAKLSNGEFVMTAAAVKNAGGGDIELGAKRLMDLNNMLSYGKPADQLKVQHVK
jgi:hypothetical protein